jgi:nitrite reductase/ring-hydroxylating ferredoxin subunit
LIVKLCAAEDLPVAGELKAFRGGDHFDICITQMERGELVAFDNRCPHQAAPLSAGHMEGCRVICPYHAWSWDVTTGKSDNAADPDLPRYEVRRYGDEVFIQLPTNPR